MKVVLSLLLLLTIVPTFASDLVVGEISALGDATHIEFKGKSSWDYVLREESGGKIVLRLPALDSSTLNQLKSWTGPLIKDVDVNKNGPDGHYLVTFRLKNSQVKAFDYLTDAPSRLVIDFYLPAKHTRSNQMVAEKKPIESKAPENKVTVSKKRAPASAKKIVTKKVTATRAPAGTDFITVNDAYSGGLENGGEVSKEFRHGIYDGADTKFERFRIKESEIDESAIIASKKNIYLRFPVLDLGLPYLRILWSNPPSYEILPDETQENKIARFLIVLFNDKKHAMFDKTVKYFRDNFPKSKYADIIGYMEADLHYSRWRSEGSLAEFEKAMVRYRQVVERYPESKLAERTFLLMGYSYLERGDSLGALKIFQRFLSQRPNTKFRDKAELAIGEAFLRLNRYKHSLKVYQKVANSAQHKRNKIEAKYLMGDASYKRGEFDRAIRSYKRALEEHPEVWRSYPNAPFNLAESYFWGGEYIKSMDHFIEFVRKFPAHPYGGYAMTRLGEILEILGAPKSKIMGTFLESFFRYRSTPGGKLARVRILTERIKDMKEKELEEAMVELEEIISSGALEKTDQFVRVKTSDGFFERKDFDRATEVLLKYYRDHPAETNVGVFQMRIVRNIASKIKGKVDKGDFIGGLRVYSEFKDTWLKRSKRLDIGLFVGKAYEQAGVYNEADRVYRKTLNRLYSILDTQAEKERSTFEKLPKTDSLNLRLAAVASKQSEYRKANDFLKEISRPDKLSQPEQIELVELASKVAEERGQVNTAISFLKKVSENWKGQPEMVSGPFLKLAELQAQKKRYSRAIDSTNKVLNLVEDTGKVNGRHHFKALNLKAEVLLKKGKKKQAVSTYKDLLKKFSSKRDLSSTRYKTGKILFDMGDSAGAEEVWGPLQEKPESLWTKLAMEKLQGDKWGNRYKKYIDRIPAMENFDRN